MTFTEWLNTPITLEQVFFTLMITIAVSAAGTLYASCRVTRQEKRNR